MTNLVILVDITILKGQILRKKSLLLLEGKTQKPHPCCAETARQGTLPRHSRTSVSAHRAVATSANKQQATVRRSRDVRPAGVRGRAARTARRSTLLAALTRRSDDETFWIIPYN